MNINPLSKPDVTHILVMYLCIFKSHTILFDSHMTILYNKDKEAKVTGYDGKKGTDLNVIRFLNRGRLQQL